MLSAFRPLLRFADIRYGAWRFLSRVDLDACLTVNRLWKAHVDGRSMQLALRKLRHVEFVCVRKRFAYAHETVVLLNFRRAKWKES